MQVEGFPNQASIDTHKKDPHFLEIAVKSPFREFARLGAHPLPSFKLPATCHVS